MNVSSGQIVFELSSDEEASYKPKHGLQIADVISLDDDPEPPVSSKKIAITIEDTPIKRITKRNNHSTKITIQIEDSEVETSSVDTSVCNEGFEITDTNATKRGFDVTNPSVSKNSFGSRKDEPSEKIRRVSLVSQPRIQFETDNPLLKLRNKMKENPKNVSVEKTHNDTEEKPKTEMSEKIHIDKLKNNKSEKHEDDTVRKHENEFQEPKTDKRDRKCENAFTQCYNEFVETCSKLDKSADMKHILERKVKHYYRKADASYIHSDEFERMIKNNIKMLKSDPTNKWVYIKGVVDTLRERKKSYNVVTGSDVLDDPRKLQQIVSLEKTIEVLQDLVDRLENADVNFDEEDQSSYMKADRYKAQIVSAYSRLCKLRGTRMTSYSRVRIERRAAREGGPAAKLEEWVNKPIASGQPPRFPDFHDVVDCVRDACRSDSLMWSDVQVMKEARELFTRCGRALQKLRQRREWRLAESLLHNPDGVLTVDPAESSAELQERLQKNRSIAKQRERQVFDEFENRQMFAQTKYKEETDSKANEDDSQTKILDTTTDGPSSQISNTKSIENEENKSEPGPSERDTTEKEAICRESETILVEEEGTKEKGNEDSDCEVISSDEESSSDESKSESDSIRILSDSEIERCAVSDSSVGSDEDALRLLRRVETRRRGGVRYSTRVSHVRGSQSDDSDSSACVLVDSHDEDDFGSNIPASLD